MAENRVTAIDPDPNTNGDNVLGITLADGRTIDAVIDLGAAQKLVEILQRRLVFWASESAKNLGLPEFHVIDVGVAHQGPGAQLMVTTAQIGSLAIRMDDAVLLKAKAEIGRV